MTRWKWLVIAAVVVTAACLFWSGIWLTFRQMQFEVALHEGSNVVRLRVPRGTYALRIGERSMTTSFEVSGALRTDNTQIDISGKCVPPSDHPQGIAIDFAATGSQVEITLTFKKLSDGPPVLLSVGAWK